MGQAQRLAQPQAIRAIFFDVGYTLLDVSPPIPELVAAVCVRQGAHVTAAQLAAALPLAEQHFAQAAAGVAGDMERRRRDYPLLAGVFRRFVASMPAGRQRCADRVAGRGGAGGV